MSSFPRRSESTRQISRLLVVTRRMLRRRIHTLLSWLLPMGGGKRLTVNGHQRQSRIADMDCCLTKRDELRSGGQGFRLLSSTSLGCRERSHHRRKVLMCRTTKIGTCDVATASSYWSGLPWSKKVAIAQHDRARGLATSRSDQGCLWTTTTM